MIDNSFWHVFICHAHEDKEILVRPLVKALESLDVQVWYDETTLQIGNSLRREIDKGLSRATYGVVVLSPAFFNKEWPQRELDGLAAREIHGTEVILPIWYEVTGDAIRKYSPQLADKIGIEYRGDILGIAAQIALRIHKTYESETNTENSEKIRELSKAIVSDDLKRIATILQSFPSHNTSEFAWFNYSPTVVEGLSKLFEGSSILRSLALFICSNQKLPKEAGLPLIKYIRPFLNSDDCSEIGAAIASLLNFRDQYSIPKLEELATNHINHFIRNEALVTLVKLNSNKSENLILEVLQNGTNDSKIRVLDALVETESDFSLQIAESLANDNAADIQVRVNACKLIIQKLAGEFESSKQRRLQIILPIIIQEMPHENLNQLFEMIYDWSLDSVPEFFAGINLAIPLLSFIENPECDPARSLGACLMLTSNDKSELNLEVRNSVWKIIGNLSDEAFESFVQYISFHMYDWVPILDEETNKVSTLLQNRKFSSKWLALIWNNSSDTAANKVLESWKEENNYEMLQYFCRNPNSLAKDKLLTITNNKNSYNESLLANFILLK